MMAPLDAAYAVAKKSPAVDVPELMLMMEPPPPASIKGSACLHASIVPRALTAMM